MARQRKEKDVKVKLTQPDRSGPDPSQQSLLDIAEQRGLLKDGDTDEEPLVGRFGESILWGLSLTMLHFTLDVLVSNQYAVEIIWRNLITRAAQAFPSKILPYPFLEFTDHGTSYPPAILLFSSSRLTICPSPSIAS